MIQKSLVIMMLFLATPVWAQDAPQTNASNKELTQFAMSVVESYRLFEVAVNQLESPEEFGAYIRSVEDCNITLEDAKDQMLPYKVSTDEWVREPASMLYESLVLYQQANDIVLELLSSEEALGDEDKLAAGVQQASLDRQAAVSSFVEASGYLTFALINLPEERAFSGPIDWKITPRQRLAVVNTINTTFGSQIQAFRAWSANPQDAESDFEHGLFYMGLDSMVQDLSEEVYR